MNNFFFFLLIGLTQIQTEWALNEKLNQLFDVSLVMKMGFLKKNLKKTVLVYSAIEAVF